MHAQTPEKSASESAASGAASTEQLEAEVRWLRERLADLERELVDVQARTNATVAHWQERAYWLERWHLDLNAVMRRPAAAPSLAALRALRSVYRALKRMKWRIFS